MTSPTATVHRRPSLLRTDWTLLLVVATAIFFLAGGGALAQDTSSGFRLLIVFVWLFVTILIAAFGVVRHADSLAVILGEPLGTLILTLSVITIEVLMISAVMLTGSDQPTLARDTMFAVAMIVLNGLIGVSLLVGGWRHHEQQFNLSGANAYLAVIVPLALLGLVLPTFTESTESPTLSPGQSIVFVIVFLALYGIFLAIQTIRHRDIFRQPESREPELATASDEGTPDVDSDAENSTDASPVPADQDQDQEEEDHEHVVRATWIHGVMLLAYLIPVVILSKQLGYPIDYGIQTSGLPVALGGLLVAALILSPEAMSGLRAAASNQLQRSVNLFLGSVAATIGLTIPAVLIIGLLSGNEVLLGLPATDAILLAVTLVVALLTFESRRTNVLHGAVHVVLFIAYLLLIFD